ncbi:MAG TPA: universal stress protein [Bryobacteraceae bacterium]|jgi:nucleotide-binding universal stress UspA family protein|nr:universal stress protein [Bryobacteraceae bacterium]
MEFKNILFPVDFSSRSEAIVPFVRAVCNQFKANLTLLHIVEVPVMAYGAPDAPVTFDYPLDEIKASAERKLNRFALGAFAGLPVKTIAEGDPGACIAQLARAWKIDLIMLPTRGRGSFRAALLGSVTAKTLHDASCAVWTEAHCDDVKAAPAHTAWKKVVCAIDTTPEGLRLIRYASELAAVSGATVHLTHAVPVAESGPERYMDMEFAAFLADEARKKIAAMQTEAGTNFEVLIQIGNIPDGVLRTVEDCNADVVLIGRGALPHFAGRLRSHAYAIVRGMPCPVLSV